MYKAGNSILNYVAQVREQTKATINLKHPAALKSQLPKTINELYTVTLN